MKSIGDNLSGVIASLREKLAPLFAMYNADINPINGYFKADHTGFDAMLDAVTIEVTDGQIVVNNRATSEQIFVCSTDNIQGGQMNLKSMPNTDTDSNTDRPDTDTNTDTDTDTNTDTDTDTNTNTNTNTDTNTNTNTNTDSYASSGESNLRQ